MGGWGFEGGGDGFVCEVDGGKVAGLDRRYLRVL